MNNVIILIIQSKIIIFLVSHKTL